MARAYPLPGACALPLLVVPNRADDPDRALVTACGIKTGLPRAAVKPFFPLSRAQVISF